MKRYCFLRLFYQLFSYVKVKNFLTSPIQINLFLKFKPYEAFVTKRIEPITFFKNEHLLKMNISFNNLQQQTYHFF